MSRLPSLTPAKLLRALKRAGFLEHHQKGSHLFLFNPQNNLMTSIAMHAKDLPRGTQVEIIEQAGMTQEQFRKFL